MTPSVAWQRTTPGSAAREMVEVVAALTRARGRGVTVGEALAAQRSHATSQVTADQDGEDNDHHHRHGDARLAVARETERERRGLLLHHRPQDDDGRQDAADAARRVVRARATFFGLVRRGLLVAIDGPVGGTRYRCAGDSLPADPSESRAADDADLVWCALRDAEAAAGRPVTTREVNAALRAQGTTLRARSPNAVRVVLNALSRARLRGRPDARGARVLRRTLRTAIGAPVLVWSVRDTAASPGDPPAPDQALLPARSRSDALRQAVATVVEVLARPVTAREVRLWAFAHDTAVAQQVRAGSVRESFALVRGQDQRVTRGAGRLRVIATPRAVAGGPPAHYAVGVHDGLSALGVAAVVLDDEAWALALPLELPSADRLVTRAKRLRSHALLEFAAWRRESVRHHLHSVARGVEVRTRTDWLALQEHEENAARVLRQWLSDGHHASGVREHLSGSLARASARFAALDQVLGSLDAPVAPLHAPRLVGAAGAVPLDSLGPLIAAVAHQRREPEALVVRSLRRARRVPAPSTPRPRPGSDPHHPAPVWIDRVDAVCTLVRAMPAPRTRALLGLGYAVLGDAVRDADALRAWMERVPPHEQLARRALTIALGLLGEPITWHPTTGAANGDDVAAWVLSTVLGAPAEASQRLADAPREISGPGRLLLRQAQTRIRLGALMTVIE